MVVLVTMQALTWDIILPTSISKHYWDMYMLALLLYVALVEPYTICFGVEESDSSFLGAMGLVIVASFAVDIWINFRTALMVDGVRCFHACLEGHCDVHAAAVLELSTPPMLAGRR